MKRWMPVLCIAFAATSFLGASAWEGSAMMGAYGEFPDSGYYGACNSFPRNTAVEVVNLENGKSVTVIVTKGLENPGIFLLLSPEAAKALSMAPGALSRVRVSAPRNIALTPPAGPGAAADPDFNPSLLAAQSGASGTPVEQPMETPVSATPLEAGSVQETPIREPDMTAAPPTAAPASGPQEGPAQEPSVGIGSPGDAASETALEKPDEPASKPAPAVQAEDTPIREVPVVRPEVLTRPGLAPAEPATVRALLPTPEPTKPLETTEERAIVHGLSRPARGSLPVEAALPDPILVPDELPETALIREAWPSEAAPKVALADLEIRMDDSGRPEALSREPLGSLTPEQMPTVELEQPAPPPKAEPPHKEPAASASSTLPGPPPGPGDGNVIVSLEPAAPKPPEAPVKPSTPAGQPAPTAPSPAGARPAGKPEAPVSTSLIPGGYYIQIGAFKTSSALESAAARLKGSFPVTIDTISIGSNPLYRLFVGPLGRDETGIALLRVRSLGFKEAFLKN